MVMYHVHQEAMMFGCFPVGNVKYGHWGGEWETRGRERHVNQGHEAGRNLIFKERKEGQCGLEQSEHEEEW